MVPTIREELFSRSLLVIDIENIIFLQKPILELGRKIYKRYDIINRIIPAFITHHHLRKGVKISLTKNHYDYVI